MGGNTHRTNTLKHLICLALVSFLPAALALEEGTYAIRSRPGFRRIGANNDGTSDVKQVITGGKLTMWNIYPEDQGYVTRIILGDNLYSTEDGNKVVVKTADSGTRWELIESPEVEFVGTYLIKPEKEDDKRYWTVSSADGEQNVLLEPYHDPSNRTYYQRWDFIRFTPDD